MSIDFKGIELSVETWKSDGKDHACIVYYDGKNITEIFEKLELVEELNTALNNENNRL